MQWNEQREKLAAAVEAGAGLQGLGEGRYLLPPGNLSDKPFLVSFAVYDEVRGAGESTVLVSYLRLEGVRRIARRAPAGTPG